MAVRQNSGIADLDPRVTRVGCFIRKISLDELPQLFNVTFAGNLSLVSPRPHALHSRAEGRFFNEVVDHYLARHRVKAGITGWAQIHGWRGETDTHERIRQRIDHDLYYMKTGQSCSTSASLAQTPIALIRAKNPF